MKKVKIKIEIKIKMKLSQEISNLVNMEDLKVL
jgi:hypothetical protein